MPFARTPSLHLSLCTTPFSPPSQSGVVSTLDDNSDRATDRRRCPSGRHCSRLSQLTYISAARPHHHHASGSFFVQGEGNGLTQHLRRSPLVIIANRKRSSHFKSRSNQILSLKLPVLHVCSPLQTAAAAAHVRRLFTTYVSCCCCGKRPIYRLLSAAAAVVMSLSKRARTIATLPGAPAVPPPPPPRWASPLGCCC